MEDPVWLYIHDVNYPGGMVERKDVPKAAEKLAVLHTLNESVRTSPEELSLQVRMIDVYLWH
jgi:hypothetical protein